MRTRPLRGQCRRPFDSLAGSLELKGSNRPTPFKEITMRVVSPANLESIKHFMQNQAASHFPQE